MYKQRLDRFRDWLTNPKSNGYEALHCTVMSSQGKWVEIQIRSQRMDDIAEKGLAAHYKYKEVKEGDLDNNLDSWLTKVRDILDNDSSTAVDFVNDFQLSVVTEQITVFTPKGKAIDLPVNSTVLDFAYNVHTDLGNHCMGAKVNYKVVPIEHRLRASDQVEVITSKIVQPKESWLDFVKTSKATNEIKNYIKDFRKSFYNEGVSKLQELFRSQNIEYNDNNVERLRHFLKINNQIDFFYKIYDEKITLTEVRQCFKKTQKNSPWIFFKNGLVPKKKDNKPTTLKEELAEQTRNNPEQLLIDKENENLPYITAKCCNPLPGDSIIGLLREDCIEVHRTSCNKAIDEMSKFGHRIIKAKWRENEKITFLAGIKITGIDRKGLLHDLTRIISEAWNVNIKGLVMESNNGLFEGSLMVYISNAEYLNKLIQNIEKVEGIERVARM
jgi:GTP pyrophosphokinase